MTPRAIAAAGPGPAEYAFLVFGAIVMAIPSGIALGTLLFLIRVRGKAEEPEDKDLPLWGKRLWRQSVQIAVGAVFVGLVALALIASSLRR